MSKMSLGFFLSNLWSGAPPLESKVTPGQNTGEVYRKLNSLRCVFGPQVGLNPGQVERGHAIQSQTVLTIDELVFSHFFFDSSSLNVDTFWFLSSALTVN